MRRPIYRNSLRLCASLAVTGAAAIAMPIALQSSAGKPGWELLGVSQAWAESDPAPAGADSLTDLDYVAESDVSGSGTLGQSQPSLPLRQGAPLVVEPIAPPSAPEREDVDEPDSATDQDTQTLGTAMRDMSRRNPIVAVVDGEEIRWKEVIESAGDLPEEYQRRIESVFPALLDRLIDLKLLANAAREKGLDEEESLQRRVRAFEDVLLRDAYVAQTIAPQIPEADVRARYFEVLRANAGLTERHLRHVVVDSRAEALIVLQSLDDGQEFAGLARDYSTGGSAASGGDLGFMRRESLSAAFAAAAFDLPVGAYSSQPLRTEFGWHVIKVEDERKAPLPVYEELAPKLRDELARERMSAALKKLRADADLELFPEE